MVVQTFSRLLKKADQPEGREQMAKGIVENRPVSALCFLPFAFRLRFSAAC
jgi:hypothetical protein